MQSFVEKGGRWRGCGLFLYVVACRLYCRRADTCKPGNLIIHLVRLAAPERNPELEVEPRRALPRPTKETSHDM